MPLDMTPAQAIEAAHTGRDDTDLGRLLADWKADVANCSQCINFAEHAADEGRANHAHEAKRSAEDLFARACLKREAIDTMIRDMLAADARQVAA